MLEGWHGMENVQPQYRERRACEQRLATKTRSGPEYARQEAKIFRGNPYFKDFGSVFSPRVSNRFA